jgi:DNA invertase Pin-like site-specific DNA recombinase
MVNELNAWELSSADLPPHFGAWCIGSRAALGKLVMYLHQQGLDTSTPSGKAMFQMMGVFAEFERSMIRERVLAGMSRAAATGTPQRQGDRPPTDRA